MSESELELHVGDTLLVGTRLLTVVEVEGDDVVFRIEDLSEGWGSREEDSGWLDTPLTGNPVSQEWRLVRPEPDLPLSSQQNRPR